MTDRELLEKLLEKVTNMESDLQTVKKEQQGTNDRLATVETGLNTLKETTSRMEGKQHIIYEQTVSLTEHHQETMDRFDDLATKEDLEYFDQKNIKA